MWNRKKTAVLIGTVISAAMMAMSAGAADFYLNYEGAEEEVFATADADDSGRITLPEEEPEREGYVFAGWYTDAEGTEEYSKLKKYGDDQNFYAKWVQATVFEAEDTQLTGLDFDSDLTGTVDELGNKKGQGYSSNVAGKNLIVQSAQASGGEYVSNLYINGSYLDFEIQADAEDTSAKLYLVLSAEFTEMTLTPENFIVEVNGEAMDYSDIELTGVDLDSDLASGERRDFTTHYIGEITLNEGENLIRLIVNNDTHPFATGTVNALAPMVDAIEITSSANLTMTIYEN